MALADILSAEQIIPEMRATERWPAIVELIDLLVSQNKIKPPDRDNILASLKQREETMSTGIGFGIAIPHCSSDRLEEVVAAFGRSSRGIEFDALDNAPVLDHNASPVNPLPGRCSAVALSPANRRSRATGLGMGSRSGTATGRLPIKGELP